MLMIVRRRQLLWCCYGSLLIAAGPPLDLAAQDADTPVAVAKVVEREVTTGHRIVGTLNPVKVSIIGSAVDGRVIRFPVNQGDAVRQGDLLAQLRTDTLDIELDAARAELELRTQELAELKNGSRPEEIAQAEARKLSANASMEYAKSKYERTLALYNRGGAATEADLDEARSLATQAEQAFLEATATYDLVKAGPRTERIKQAEARVNLQQESIRLIEDRIAKHTLVAPFDGFVTAEHTELGAWLQQGDPVAQVVRLDEVELVVDVLGLLVTRLKRGLTVRVEVPSFPNELFTGTIERIVPQADVRSRTFPVVIRVENRIEEEVPRLKAGMLARVDLPTGTRRRMPLVPKDALVLGGPKPLVFVVDVGAGDGKTGTVRAVPVELGVADGASIQVDGPVRQGEYVVVRGNERLRSGQKVSVAKVLPVEPERRDGTGLTQPGSKSQEPRGRKDEG